MIVHSRVWESPPWVNFAGVKQNMQESKPPLETSEAGAQTIISCHKCSLSYSVSSSKYNILFPPHVAKISFIWWADGRLHYIFGAEPQAGGGRFQTPTYSNQVAPQSNRRLARGHRASNSWRKVKCVLCTFQIQIFLPPLNVNAVLKTSLHFTLFTNTLYLCSDF